MSLSRPIRTTVLLLLPALALLLLVGYLTSCRAGLPPTPAVQYHCPMHPDFLADAPGDCPICGMRLIPSERRNPPPPEPAPAATAAPAGAASAVPGRAPVAADAAGLRLAGVKTAVAERRALTRTVRTVGLVTADETRVRHVHTKISGWIEHLHVNFVGQPVRAGQPLLAIYSPQLLATQEEYLRAREAAGRFAGSSLPEVRQGGADLLTAARRRLELFDAPRSLLAALDRTGKPQRTVTLLAPASGYVTAKEVFEGMEVGPGMDLLTITDLSRVWVEADFYEIESRALGVGRPVALSRPNDP
ncbi:MAG TPA: efflux RND transporter periplasmic adaptor subunit, partial [Thermoanaerobaculia bacterium]